MLQLKKFPHIPLSSREEARGSRPHPEEPRFRLLFRDEGSFPCFVGKEFPALPSHLKRTHSPQESRGELQGGATIQESPRCHSPFQRYLLSLHYLDFHAVIDSHHSCTRHSPFGRHHGKALFEVSKDSPDPLIHSTGSVTLQLQHGFKAPAYAPTRDVD